MNTGPGWTRLFSWSRLCSIFLPNSSFHNKDWVIITPVVRNEAGSSSSVYLTVLFWPKPSFTNHTLSGATLWCSSLLPVLIKGLLTSNYACVHTHASLHITCVCVCVSASLWVCVLVFWGCVCVCASECLCLRACVYVPVSVKWEPARTQIQTQRILP